MLNIAEFSILGRVGKIKDFQGKINVTICANLGYKTKDGWKDEPHWNEVSIFAEGARKYITDNCQAGDLVMARGRMNQNRFEKDGQKIYSVDFIATEFSIIAHKLSDVQDHPTAPTAEAKKTRDKSRR